MRSESAPTTLSSNSTARRDKDRDIGMAATLAALASATRTGSTVEAGTEDAAEVLAPHKTPQS